MPCSPKASGWRLLVRGADDGPVGAYRGRHGAHRCFPRSAGACPGTAAAPTKNEEAKARAPFSSRASCSDEVWRRNLPKNRRSKASGLCGCCAREAETGSLEPFLFRTYPREQGTAPVEGRETLQAVAATCAAPAVFAPVQIDGESYVDGGVVANDPIPPRSRGSRVGVPRQACWGRGFTRMRPDQEGAPGGAAGGAALVPRVSQRKPREELSGTERWFRRVGLTWDHEPRIRTR